MATIGKANKKPSSQNMLFSTFKAKTSINSSLFTAGIFVLIVFLINKYALSPIPEDNLSFLQLFRQQLFERGIIPLLLLLFFFFGLSFLVIFNFFKIIPISKSYEAEAELINAAYNRNEQRVISLLNSKQRSQEGGYYTDKLLRLYLKRQNSKDNESVRELKNELIDIDEESILIDLIPLKICEWILPLLGFLGTVIGVSASIKNMKEGVQLAFDIQQINEQVLNLFNQGFLDLALAFDTTFLGLFFLLIIGWFHNLSKRSASREINRVREVMTMVVSSWELKEDATVVGLTELKVGLTGLNVGLTGLKDQIRILNHTQEFLLDQNFEVKENSIGQQRFNRTAFRIFETIVEEAKGFDHIRDVLIGRVVQADLISTDIQKKLKDIISKNNIVNYSIKQLAVSCITKVPFCAVSIVKDSTKSFLFLMDFEDSNDRNLEIDAPAPLAIISYSDSGQKLYCADENGNIYFCAPNYNTKNTLRKIAKEPPLNLKMTFIKEGQEELLVVFPWKTNQYQNISLYNTESKIILKETPVIDQPIMSCTSNGLNIIAITTKSKKQTSNTRVKLLQLRRNKIQTNKDSETQTSNDTINNLKIIADYELKNDNITQLCFLGQEEVIFTTKSKELYYWNYPQSEYPQIVDSQNIQISPSYLSAGKKGWLCFKNDKDQKLYMARIKNGILKCDKKERFDIQQNINDLMTTPNGAYAVAYTDENIFVWRMPVTLIDTVAPH